MKHTSRRCAILALSLGVLAAVGCAGSRAERADVAPGMLAPNLDNEPNRMLLGAGDAWGRVIYIQYLASLERAEHADTAYAAVDANADVD